MTAQTFSTTDQITRETSLQLFLDYLQKELVLKIYYSFTIQSWNNK